MKTRQSLYYGNTFLYNKTKTISLETLTMNGSPFFKIKNYNQMNPFFMTVVSNTDQWMFISSTGGLTCGRKNADSALFPYYTDDKIHDSFETTGSHTVFIVTKEERNFLWTPFSSHKSDVYDITRNLYKNTVGNKIMFEEINHDLELTYTYTWKMSDRYGFIKESGMVNLDEKQVEIRVLDGIRNILPYGVSTLLQTTRSTLVDGYKRCELVEEAGLGIYTLSSIVTDKAEPSESLKATTVWSTGLNNPKYLLSEEQVKAFFHNEKLQTEVDIKGRRGAYYVEDSICIKGQQSKHWYIIAELNQGATNVEKLIKEINENPSLNASIEADILNGEYNLKKLVFNADGFQCTSNARASYRHFSNTLYNIMRGGIYADAYDIDREDFKTFVNHWNNEIYVNQQAFINDLPETINYHELLRLVSEGGSKDFERLVFEYLPLTFSRRHGDPSRPWNKFNIEISKEDGSKELRYEGNWRDIFQNWEALSISYPEYLESIIAKFVNASTADGYNPYRITKNGIDWEVIDPKDPWSNIGYWGDHQIIYLLKLMELSKAYHPEKLQELLYKDIFVYANVPYRIKGFDALVKDPRNSIVYDNESERCIEEKTIRIGSDGKLVFCKDAICKVNLMEKLLVSLLAKFSNYVPEGGIWMNTQRPEWNDANNALVGNGMSMVTLYYMHRFQVFLGTLVKDIKKETVELSIEVLQMFNDTAKVLRDSEQYIGNNISDAVRFHIVKSLGIIGETYRNTIYDHGFSGDKGLLKIQSLQRFIELSIRHLKDSIQKNKRKDGLYHAYNLIRFDEEKCSVSYLYEMLEGQVAVLSSKALDAKEAISVLDALKNSAIYRQDQRSYMLYPNRELPKFLMKNVIPEAKVMASSLLKEEIRKKSTRIIEKDIHGKYHFNGQFRNGEEVRQALKATKEYPDEAIEIVEEIFTELFEHHAFTGRSGTFYKYEGLGSIYWHMVSKLLLATQENFNAIYNQKGMNEEAKKFMKAYETIKEGIGLEKSPEQYGAFPTDAYSHTPGFAGVQQPGMTGQVKEDVLSRFGEFGVEVVNGCVRFDPKLLAKSEFLKEVKHWSLPKNSKEIDEESIRLDKNSLGFTFCTIPIIYHLDHKKEIIVCYKDGTKNIFEATNTLDLPTSQKVFNREGKICKINVYIDKSIMI